MYLIWGEGGLSELAFILVVAFSLDRILGEPQRAHPLVGYGRFVSWLEAALYGPEEALHLPRLFRGLMAGLIAIVLPLGLLLWLSSWTSGWLNTALAAVIVYLCIAAKSLHDHADRVYHALSSGQLDEARSACAMMVSRDTSELNEGQIAKATIESVLENANDAVIAPAFWFVLAGLPGILLFRMANTLDAMWGYRNTRYLYFGRFVARLDDVLGYLPARVSVILFTLLNPEAWRVFKRDAGRWYSPNAGPVMAAGAGGLGLKLGGTASYHGSIKVRPVLGQDREPEVEDIRRTLKFVQGAYVLMLTLVCFAAFALGAVFTW